MTPITFKFVSDAASLLRGAAEVKASLEETVRPVPKIIDTMNSVAGAAAKVQQEVQRMGSSLQSALAAERSLRDAMAGRTDVVKKANVAQREQSDQVEVAGRRFRRLTEEERAARRASQERTETATRGAAELKDLGFRVSQVSSAVRVFGIVGGPIVGRVAEALERAGVGIRGLSTTSVGAQLGVGGLMRVLTIGLPILAAGVGLFLGLKAAVGAVKEATSDDKNRQLLSVLRGGRQAGDAAIRERRAQSAEIGVDYEEFIKGAVALERLSKGALGSKRELQLLEAMALSGKKSFSDLAETVGNLNRKLIEGSSAKEADERRTAAKKELDELVTLGFVTKETQKKVMDLQEAGKKGPAVWALVAADLERTRRNTADVGETFTTASTKVSNAWGELKATIGAPIADALTPVLGTVTAAIQRLTSWVNLAIFGLKTLNNLVGEVAGSETVERLGGPRKGGAAFSAGAEVKAPPGAPGPFRPDLQDPTKDKDKKGGKNNEMEETRRLVEQLRLAQQSYNSEIEITNLLKQRGQISAAQAEAADRQQTVQYMARLKEIQAEIDKLIKKETAAGNERAVGKLSERAKELEKDLQRAELALTKLTTGGKIKLGLVKLQNEFSDIGEQVTQLATQSITQGINTMAGALTGLILRTGDAKQAFAGYVSSVLEGLLQIGAKWVYTSTLKILQDRREAASTTAKAGAQVTALTPVALLESVISFGVAALVGLAAMAAVTALTGGFAEGGHVRGPGGPKSDSIFARLSNGEFVMPARAVDFFGVENLEAMRNLRIPQLGVPSMSNGAIALSRGISPTAGAAGGRSGGSGPSLPPRISLMMVNTRQEALAAAKSAQGDVVIFDSMRRQAHKLPFRRK